MAEQENERIARLWFEEIANKNNLRIADEIVHPDYKPQGSPFWKKGANLVKSEMANKGKNDMRTWFPDIRYEILEIGPLPDRVWIRYKATGTHQGKFWGFEPAGGIMEVEGVTILYIKDNKVIDIWNTLSLYDMLVSLSLVPPLWALKDHLDWLT